MPRTHWLEKRIRKGIAERINEALKRSGLLTSRNNGFNMESDIYNEITTSEEYRVRIRDLKSRLRESGKANDLPRHSSDKSQTISNGATQPEKRVTSPLTKVFEADEPSTLDQFFKFREWIARKNDEAEEGQVPRFEKISFKHGIIDVLAADKWSEHWTRSQASKSLILREGVNLRIKGYEPVNSRQFSKG